MIKFISYDGEYPTLCRGVLVIEKDGEVYTLDDVLDSNGDIKWDEDGEGFTIKDKWTIHLVRHLPDELMPFEKEILEVVNQNVPWGCCGGCIG